MEKQFNDEAARVMTWDVIAKAQEEQKRRGYTTDDFRLGAETFNNLTGRKVEEE